MFETNEKLKEVMRKNKINRREVARLLHVTNLTVYLWLHPFKKHKMPIQMIELLQYKIKDKIHDEKENERQRSDNGI